MLKKKQKKTSNVKKIPKAFYILSLFIFRHAYKNLKATQQSRTNHKRETFA